MRESKAPWMIRTYTGFGTARETNARFRENLAKGQRGLSIAFDLPTQNGYDADAPMAGGEVGVTGVSIAHHDDMAELLDGIPLGEINTSMTINATACWLMALYIVLAERQGVPLTQLRGTTQNDLLKEFVARGTYAFDPATSLRLSTDLIGYTTRHVPQWNPINCCGYHYMESGAGPVEEVGYAFGNACLILDVIRPNLSAEEFATVVRRISFFINSGIELVPEIAKVRAYFQLWPVLCRELYGVEDVQFRAGCQVRSLGLTEQQPELNIVRIALEALPVIMQAGARVGALQLPGFREALQLPDAAEQTLSLRTQHILMHETQLTASGDIFAGSHLIERETTRTVDAARALAGKIRAMGYTLAVDAIGSALGEAMVERQRRITTGELPIVGVNCFQSTETLGSSLTPRPASGPPLTRGFDARMSLRVAELQKWRTTRDQGAWGTAVEDLRRAMRSGDNIMPASIALARASGTTGEWTDAIASVCGGRFTLPIAVPSGQLHGVDVSDMSMYRSQRRSSHHDTLTHRTRIVLAKVGLDGHINALKILAHACREAGMEVICLGARQTPESVVAAAIAEDVSLIGISSLAGSHLHIAEEILTRLRTERADDCRLIMGGIIPPADVAQLQVMGVAEIFTPQHTDIGSMIERMQSLACHGER